MGPMGHIGSMGPIFPRTKRMASFIDPSLNNNRPSDMTKKVASSLQRAIDRARFRTYTYGGCRGLSVVDS